MLLQVARIAVTRLKHEARPLRLGMNEGVVAFVWNPALEPRVPEAVRAGHGELMRAFGASAVLSRRMADRRPIHGRRADGSLFPSESISSPQTDSPQIAATEGEITLQVQNSGYFPTTLKAPAGQDLTLNLITDQTYSCARDFVIPALNYYKLLPDTGTVQVTIPAQKAGSTLFFTCSMGMYTGQIIFE